MKHHKNSKKLSAFLENVDYGRYKRTDAEQLFDVLASDLSKDTKGRKLKGDIEASLNFIRKAFDNFEGKNAPDNTSFAFVVPTRIMRGSDKNSSEATQFLPILKYVDAATRQRVLMSVPPSVVGHYKKDANGKQGRIIFAPVFGDMINDFGRSPIGKYKLRRRVDQIMNDVGDFAHDKLGAEMVGLGAILPKVTGLGRRIKTKGLTTTTGHGGTVWLILETIKKVLGDELVDFDGRFGIVGAGGAIASSTTELLLEEYPQAQIFVRDKRKDMNSAVEKRYAQSHPGRVKIAKSNMDVLSSANVIVSAVTTAIDVEPHVDLNGKIIIDDSQPGSFDLAQVEKRGGKLIWVVGSDSKDKPTLVRNGEFTFGEDDLVGNTDLWGCEAEVGVLSATGEYGLAVQEPVNARIIRQLDPVLKGQKITVAQYQAYGKKIDF